MLQQTLITQPFQYRLPADIPITGFPTTFYNGYLTTPPRIYGEEWDTASAAIFLNPEDLADGYEVIWLGMSQAQVRWPSYNWTWYRFNASTGEWLGRVDALNDYWLFSIFGQSRDGTLWKLTNSTIPLLAYPCTATATGVVPSSVASFDFTAFAGMNGIGAFCIDVEQNLLIANTNDESNVKVWNLTTGALIRTIPMPSIATVVMPVDLRLCYVMTSTGIMCLVDYQAGTVLAAYTVQSTFSAFGNFKTITYDVMYRRFLSWVYTPVDGTGQNTSVIRGFYPVPVAVGITKPIPVRPPRKYRTTPILNRVYGDVGEAIGGGVVSLSLVDPTLGAVVGFPALTDTDGESIASINCTLPGSETIIATVALASGIGGSGGAGPAPAPPPYPAPVRQAGDFPRLAGYLVSGSTDYDNPTRQAQIAQLDLAVLAFPPAWVGSSGATMQQALLAMRAINPRLVFLNYTDIIELADPLTGPYGAVNTEVNAFYWWLYDHSAPPANMSAAKIASGLGADYQINITQYTPPNLAGQNYPTWRAGFDTLYSTAIAPACNGIYIDKTTTFPLVDGDYDRDGDTTLGDPPDLHTDGAVGNWWRAGFVAYINALRAAMPAGAFVFANSGDWAAGIGAFAYQTNGGVMESMIGQSYSYETTSFAAMMSAYGNIMALTSAPQLQIFAHDGSLTDYQDFRYGLCSCLLGNGYYYHSDGAGVGGYHDVNWFDEFDFLLGVTTSEPPSSAYQNGIWRRDFAYGIALVNPKGNGSQTITLETAYTHLTGSQAPAVNDGSTSATVTLADRDGIVLMRVP